jgi:hypothetical protein
LFSFWAHPKELFYCSSLQVIRSISPKTYQVGPTAVLQRGLEGRARQLAGVCVDKCPQGKRVRWTTSPIGPSRCPFAPRVPEVADALIQNLSLVHGPAEVLRAVNGPEITANAVNSYVFQKLRIASLYFFIFSDG